MTAGAPGPCVTDDDLVRLVDGEISVNGAAQVRAHVAGCTRCARALAAVEELVGDLRAPLEDVDDAALVAKVLARVERAAVVAPAPARRKGTGIAVALASAALAIAAAVALAPRLRRAPDEGSYAARGNGAPVSLGRGASVSFYAVATPAKPAPARELAPGAVLPRDVALAAAYRNVRAGAATYLLAFAVDARGAVHWLYPAYESAGTDPASIPLAPVAGLAILPSSVVLDDPAPGALRLVSVLGERPRHVSDVEALPASALDLASLRARWPDAVIDQTVVTLSP